jgi:hypothetical protein
MNDAALIVGPAPANLDKALLICTVAEDLSMQCTIHLRHGAMDGLLDLQARKHQIVEELAAILRGLDVAALPELHRAVERLRAALRLETSALTDASHTIQNELISVNAAQRRLTHARHYSTAALSLPLQGSQLSVTG